MARSARATRGGDGRSGVLGHLDRLGQHVVGHAKVAGQQVGDPQQQLRRRPPQAAHRDQRQGQLGVGPHLGDPVAAQLGPQQGPPALDRGAAVGQHPLIGSPFGGIGPPLGRGGVAAQRLHPGPQHGHRGILLDQPVVVEPVEPSLDGGQPTAAVDGDGCLLDASGDQVGIAGVHGVADRGLGQPVVLAPSGRPAGELAHQLGLVALQLPTQQLPEQRMVAVPLPLAIQRDDQQVGPLQRLKHRGRAGGVQDRVAQRPRQAIQHRGPGQERHLGRRQAGQQLRLQVVDQEPLPPAEPDPGAVPGGLGLDRQGGQVQGHRPALGPPGQLGHLGIGQLDPGRGKQRPGLRRAHRQLTRAQLGQAALGPPARHRQRRLCPG